MFIKPGHHFLIGHTSEKIEAIQSTAEQIAAFIMKYQYEDIIITNLFDETVITTTTGMIHFCADQNFLATELIPILAPMQMGEAEIIEFIPLNLKETDKKSINSVSD